MDFEKRTSLQVKILTGLIGVLAIYCTIHNGLAFPWLPLNILIM